MPLRRPADSRFCLRLSAGLAGAKGREKATGKLFLKKCKKIGRGCKIPGRPFVLWTEGAAAEGPSKGPDITQRGVCRLSNEQFADLMRQYQRLIYTVCYQFVHDPHTAEDLTQDTFLSAYSYIDRCDPAYYKQWLVRVATNKCKDHLKSAWVRRVQAQEDDQLPEPRGTPPGEARSPEEAIIVRDETEQLRQMIRTLREPYGSVATMYLLEQKPVPVIAQALGRPEKTVQNQIFRAKVILRRQIEERRQT